MDLFVRVHVVYRLPRSVRRAPLPELQWRVDSAAPAGPGRAGRESGVWVSSVQPTLLGETLTVDTVVDAGAGPIRVRLSYQLPCC